MIDEAPRPGPPPRCSVDRPVAPRPTGSFRSCESARVLLFLSNQRRNTLRETQISVPIHPAQAEPDEPCHRIKVTVQPLVQHDDEKSERRKSQRVATTGGKPVRAQQSLKDDHHIENEPEESEACTRVAEITVG